MEVLLEQLSKSQIFLIEENWDPKKDFEDREIMAHPLHRVVVRVVRREDSHHMQVVTEVQEERWVWLA
jgi:hypothetical protein